MKQLLGIFLLLGLLLPARADIAFMPASNVRVVASAGQASVTGTTNETNLASLRVPANTLGANGVIQVVALWSYTNSSNNKTLVVRFNPNQFGTTGGVTGASLVATTTASAQTMTIIRANNSTTAQIAYTGAGSAPFGAAASAPTAIGTDTRSDTYVNVNGQLAVGTETITLVHAYAVVFPSN